MVYLTEIRIHSSDDKPSTESSLFSKANPIGDNERQEFEEGDKVSDPETNAGGDPSQQVPDQRVPNVCSEKQEEIGSTDGGCGASEKTIAASSDPDSLLARIDRGQNAQNVLKREATAESMSPLGMSEVRTTRTSSSCLNVFGRNFDKVSILSDLGATYFVAKEIFNMHKLNIPRLEQSLI